MANDDMNYANRRAILSSHRIDTALHDAHKQSIIERKTIVIDKLTELNGQQRRRIAELEAELAGYKKGTSVKDCLDDIFRRKSESKGE